MKKLERELAEFIDKLTADLRRPERREALRLYMTGLLLDGEPKSIQPLAARLVDSDAEIEGMRQAIWRSRTAARTLPHVIKVFDPGIKASSSKLLVFGGGGGEAREVPAQRVGLSNDDEAYAFARTKVQRFGRSEKAILVQRFDGAHANKSPDARVLFGVHDRDDEDNAGIRAIEDGVRKALN